MPTVRTNRKAQQAKFAKAIKRAKTLKKSHPNAKFSNLVKQAYKELYG